MDKEEYRHCTREGNYKYINNFGRKALKDEKAHVRLKRKWNM